MTTFASFAGEMSVPRSGLTGVPRRGSRFRPTFATQVLLAQVAVLLFVVASAFGLTAWLLREELERQYQQQALMVARSVASDPVVIQHVATRELSPDVQRRATAARSRTGALFISVIDRRGVRYAHVDPDHVGLRGTVTAEVLAGREIAATEHGTLGTSARGRVPIRAEDGAVVGEVVVGIRAEAITDRLTDLLGAAAGLSALAVALGVVASGALARRLKRQTLGLEPLDLGDLWREREAVLHGIDEGVLAVDQDNLVTICNDAAAALTGTSVSAGTRLADAGLPQPLRVLLEERHQVRGRLVVTDERTLIVSALPVRRAEFDLGHVLTIRDRTELDHMAQELDVTRALSDALRAQAHEHTNRMHTVLGMLGLGDAEAAAEYLRQLFSDPLAVEHGDLGPIRDPYVRGVLAAKKAAAAERGVRLELGEATYLPNVIAPLDVVTVLGNLVDNAVAAAATGNRQPPWVEVSLVTEAGDLQMVVVDSGNGVPQELRNRLFEPGVTTKTDRRQSHGVGLTLARQITRRHGGDLELTEPAGSDCGAVFVARLRGVVQLTGEGSDVDVGPAPRAAEGAT